MLFAKRRVNVNVAYCRSDSESNRKMLKTLLGKLGVTVSTAENGRAAVEACRARSQTLTQQRVFDVVFMDNEMPVMVPSILAY